MNNNISNADIQAMEDYLKRVRPQDPEVLEQLDIVYLLERNAFIICERRVNWMWMMDKSEPKTYHNIPCAKIHYQKTQNRYKIYWKRASGKWQHYDPYPFAQSLQEALDIVEGDAYGCFWG